ncbi:hypothetical protein BC833DRAFT_622107 [Globomyces pollinis-pini]|nr:hypothetical protein BC833DRAFT_622107 [Globomyces pollinis-pini]KAJ2996002.1 hypothetical protein HDV02_000231 [Globomyces sp. JEL0801]
MSVISCLQDLRKVGRVEFDQKTLESYAHGLSYHAPIQPEMVFRAFSEKDIVNCLTTCNKYSIPVVTVSGRSSLEGQTVPLSKGVVILDTSYMDKVVAIHEEDLDCVVEPGCNWVELAAELKECGLFFPPDPGMAAMIGGMCGTNCSGSFAWRYGTMKDNVISLRVVLADGTVIKTRRRPTKSSAGYDLTRLIIGSEGTLGVVSQATLKLRRIPTEQAVLIAQFPSIVEAANTAMNVVQSGLMVNRMEFLDEFAMKSVNLANAQKNPRHENATLLFECVASCKASLQYQMDALASICKEQNSILFERDTSEASNELWNIRKSAFFASKSLRPDVDCDVLTTDVAVPISHLKEMLIATRNDLQENNIVATIVAHAGDGNIHCFIPMNKSCPEEVHHAEQFKKRNAQLALDFDGTCTGEHGVGQSKRKLLIEELGVETVNVMRRIKKELDPKSILNPGKVFSLSPESKL